MISTRHSIVFHFSETFCKDAGITIDEANAAIANMRAIDNIKEVFQLLFEQLEASVSFDVFYNVMQARNLAIQQQVLAMILTLTGGKIPECMTPGINVVCHLLFIQDLDLTNGWAMDINGN